MFQKSKNKKIIRLWLCLLPSFLLCSCLSKPLNILENDYFEYIVIDSSTPYSDKRINNSNEKIISIVGLTKFALEKTSIDIPREIEGLPVRYIGWEDWTTGQGRRYLGLGRVSNTSTLKKIFFYENIKEIIYQSLHECSLFNCSLNDIGIYGSKVNAYASFELSNSDNDYLKSDVVFYSNNQMFRNPIYRVDVLNENGKLDIPPEPFLEGFSFGGWYTESECTNKYNFETVNNLLENESITLYANWIRK